ncbi:MAG TPA: amino acid ABC transporter substrate-binding protein [Clostridiales bacterium]|nr:amino acid ABC transporter substrate-binding protein [Clostridiales bacterium]
MKKLFGALAAAAMTVLMAVSLTACGGKQVKIIEIDLSTEQYGIAVKKGDTKMKEEVDGVLEKLKGDGVTVDGKTVTFNSLYTAEMEAQEKGELISIGEVKKQSTDRSKELVVATNAEFAPFEYMVGESFGGIDMQVAKIIANELGKELVVLHMSFEVVLEAVGSSADIGMAGLTINEDRMKTVDFSEPYYDTTQRIAVLAEDTDFDGCTDEASLVKALKELKGVTAGAAKAQTGYFYLVGNESFEFEGFANIQTKQYASIALAVQDLANGKLKLVCGDKDTLSAAVKAINK